MTAASASIEASHKALEKKKKKRRKKKLASCHHHVVCFPTTQATSTRTVVLASSSSVKWKVFNYYDYFSMIYKPLPLLLLLIQDPCRLAVSVQSSF